MRSALIAGLLALAGCTAMNADQQASGAPQATATTAAVTTAEPSEMHFKALGTEPFWGLEVLPGQLKYSSPENLGGTIFAATQSIEGSQRRYSGTLEGKAVTLVIEPGECSDGMSDQVFAYKATFTWGDRTERGCARLL